MQFYERLVVNMIDKKIIMMIQKFMLMIYCIVLGYVECK